MHPENKGKKLEKEERQWQVKVISDYNFEWENLKIPKKIVLRKVASRDDMLKAASSFILKIKVTVIQNIQAKILFAYERQEVTHLWENVCVR